MQDFIRVAAAVPKVAVGNVQKNVERIIEKANCAADDNPQIIVFPELCLTGYTAADLFFQENLLTSSIDGLKRLIEFSKSVDAVLAVGLPIVYGAKLYNCCAVILGGRLLGLVPKQYIPSHNEFYEKRWFSSGMEVPNTVIAPSELGLDGVQSEGITFGNAVFTSENFNFAVEICEDLWSPVPPSSLLALNGADVIINLSASNETIAKRDYRKSLVLQQSARTVAGYVYASAGCNESTTDLIFSGHSIISQNGKLIAENKKTIDDDYILFGDIDVASLRADRLKTKTFSECGDMFSLFDCEKVHFSQNVTDCDLKYYSIEKLPFVPSAKADRLSRCLEIFEMQVMALKKRMDVTNAKPVIGISGGLDSTLALLVCVEAVRRADRPLSDVIGITMPCFGTTDRTYQNSLKLMEILGITALEIPIKSAVEQHFCDIGQDRNTFDLTFENAQARERTQVLMDYAGKSNGFVVGTGDLSELALGWCTYNADHMSMYGVNCGIPKTLVRWMVATLAEDERFAPAKDVLSDILDTPISPELLPPDENGAVAQQTEDIVGPYSLHDFFLYYAVRFGFAPKKIFALACRAFSGDFDPAYIKRWLVTFYRRFFTQQFKRSCLPDGVKIGSIALSPRGDWRMPSDAEFALWVNEAESIEI